MTGKSFPSGMGRNSSPGRPSDGVRPCSAIHSTTSVGKRVWRSTRRKKKRRSSCSANGSRYGRPAGEAGRHHLQIDFFPRRVVSPQISEGEGLVPRFSRQALKEIVEPRGQRPLVPHARRETVEVPRDLCSDVVAETESRPDDAADDRKEDPRKPTEESGGAAQERHEQHRDEANEGGKNVVPQRRLGETSEPALTANGRGESTKESGGRRLRLKEPEEARARARSALSSEGLGESGELAERSSRSLETPVLRRGRRRRGDGARGGSPDGAKSILEREPAHRFRIDDAARDPALHDDVAPSRGTGVVVLGHGFAPGRSSGQKVATRVARGARVDS